MPGMVPRAVAWVIHVGIGNRIGDAEVMGGVCFGDDDPLRGPDNSQRVAPFKRQQRHVGGFPSLAKSR
jgi:hypothetical protein